MCLILWWKFFAVSDCLKSGTDEYHQKLSFLLETLLVRLLLELVFRSSHLQFHLQLVKSCSLSLRSADWLGEPKKMPLMGLQKILGCFHKCLSGLVLACYKRFAPCCKSLVFMFMKVTVILLPPWGFLTWLDLMRRCFFTSSIDCVSLFWGCAFVSEPNQQKNETMYNSCFWCIVLGVNMTR